MFTASGKGSIPLLFVPISVRKRGADNAVHVFLCICVRCQCWSISGWVPVFTNYHFNHYPQRRGRGMKYPKKIVQIFLPMFRQGCLVFTGGGSRCERESCDVCFKQRRNQLSLHTSFLCVCSQMETLHYREKGLSSRPGKQEGLDGSDAAARQWDPTTSCPALSHNSLDHTFRKWRNDITQRKENFTSKYQLQLRFGKFWVGHGAGFSHLSHQSVQLAFPMSFAGPPAETLSSPHPASEPTTKRFSNTWLPQRKGDARALWSNQR